MVCTASTPPFTDSLGSCRVECRHLDKPTRCPSTKRVRKPFTRAEQHCVSFVIPTECTLCGQYLIRTRVLWTGTVGHKMYEQTRHPKIHHPTERTTVVVHYRESGNPLEDTAIRLLELHCGLEDKSWVVVGWSDFGRACSIVLKMKIWQQARGNKINIEKLAP
jgi:hypothetical protein